VCVSACVHACVRAFVRACVKYSRELRMAPFAPDSTGLDLVLRRALLLLLRVLPANVRGCARPLLLLLADGAAPACLCASCILARVCVVVTGKNISHITSQPTSSAKPQPRTGQAAMRSSTFPISSIHDGRHHPQQHRPRRRRSHCRLGPRIRQPLLLLLLLRSCTPLLCTSCALLLRSMPGSQVFQRVHVLRRGGWAGASASRTSAKNSSKVCASPGAQVLFPTCRQGEGCGVCVPCGLGVSRPQAPPPPGRCGPLAWPKGQIGPDV